MQARKTKTRSLSAQTANLIPSCLPGEYPLSSQPDDKQSPGNSDQTCTVLKKIIYIYILYLWIKYMKIFKGRNTLLVNTNWALVTTKKNYLQVAPWSKAWISWRSRIVQFESGRTYPAFVRAVCYQVEVPARCRSLATRSPTECVCVAECDEKQQ